MSDREPLGLRLSRSRAAQLLRQPNRLQALLQKVMTKVNRHEGALSKVIHELKLMLRWLRAWLSGKYPVPNTQAIILAVAGLIYLVNPLDLIPDFIFHLGLIDDLSILLFVGNQLRDELKAFEEWEKEQKSCDS